jgi:predicted lysophospholipase L1 biosynthesis ABC-type transport system permease subunit
MYHEVRGSHLVVAVMAITAVAAVASVMAVSAVGTAVAAVTATTAVAVVAADRQLRQSMSRHFGGRGGGRCAATHNHRRHLPTNADADSHR